MLLLLFGYLMSCHSFPNVPEVHLMVNAFYNWMVTFTLLFEVLFFIKILELLRKQWGKDLKVKTNLQKPWHTKGESLYTWHYSSNTTIFNKACKYMLFSLHFKVLRLFIITTTHLHQRPDLVNVSSSVQK